MSTFFEIKTRYNRMQESGAVKAVTESFLADALSFAEAEATAIDRVADYATDSEVSIRAVKRTPIAEVFSPDAEKFFLAKVAFVTLDEKTGAEKESVSQMLVGASDIDEAKKTFEEAMKGTVSDYVLKTLSETSIVQVWLHN